MTPGQLYPQRPPQQAWQITKTGNLEHSTQLTGSSTGEGGGQLSWFLLSSLFAGLCFFQVACLV